MMQENVLTLPSEEHIRSRLKTLHQLTPDAIGAMLEMELVSYDPEAQSCVLRAKTEYWMRNGNGTLHGGLGATLLDHSMGAMVYCIKREGGICPTMQMQCYYHRPLKPGADVLAKVTVTSRTRRFFYMSAQIFQANAPEKLCVSGSAIYVYQEDRG